MKSAVDKKTASNNEIDSSISSKILLDNEKRESSELEGIKISNSDSISSASIMEPKVMQRRQSFDKKNRCNLQVDE
jgi:hypothetical protein